MNYIGDFPVNSMIYVIWNTFATTGASVTMTGLTTSTIQVYKSGSMTQRASTAGFVLLDTDGIDIDTTTGIHGLSIDTSDNTTAGFYASGHDYWVVVNGVTINAVTVSFIAARFSIENRNVGLKALVRGVCTTGGSTTSIVTSSLLPAAAVTDQFKGRIVIFDKETTTANLRGQATNITASTSGGVLTVTALTTAPANLDTFGIY